MPMPIYDDVLFPISGVIVELCSYLHLNDMIVALVILLNSFKSLCFQCTEMRYIELIRVIKPNWSMQIILVISIHILNVSTLLVLGGATLKS